MRYLYLFFLLLPACPASAQSLFYVRSGCAVNTAEMGANHYVFDPSEEASRIIATILDANGLQPNFIIKSGDVDNALAVQEAGERYIIYNTAYIERIKQSAGTDWAAFYVFAHEIGHHLNNHRFDLRDAAKRKEQELQADLFAGNMLYRLGAPLDDAQTGTAAVCNERESDTHPPRRARLEAVASGWKKAKEQIPVQPGVIQLENAPDEAARRPDDMVFIKGGTFDMGSTESEDEKPLHAVTISDFYLAKHEVTVQAFRTFVEATGYVTDAEQQGSAWGLDNNEWKDVPGRNWRHDPEGSPADDDHPVIYVSWNDAVAYCKWMSQKTGKKYRLPTEAEWEYAAGNGDKHHRYSWGDGNPSGNKGGNVADETAKRKFSDWEIFSGYSDGYIFTAPAGSFQPNTFGLYDMTGNVWEWCADWHASDYYAKSPVRNPQGPAAGLLRVCRGGSWSGLPAFCRVAFRSSNSPGYRDSDLGFRLARTP